MGAVAGGLVAFYLIGKITELVAWKRVFTRYSAMVWISSLSVFFIIFLIWFTQRDKPYAFHPAMFVDYAIACVILPLIRIFWHRRKDAKRNVTGT